MWHTGGRARFEGRKSDLQTLPPRRGAVSRLARRVHRRRDARPVSSPSALALPVDLETPAVHATRATSRANRMSKLNGLKGDARVRDGGVRRSGRVEGEASEGRKHRRSAPWIVARLRFRVARRTGRAYVDRSVRFRRSSRGRTGLSRGDELKSSISRGQKRLGVFRRI